jgi:hypothetical protein
MTNPAQQLKQAETNIAVLQVRLSNLEEKIDDIKANLNDLRDDMDTQYDKITDLLKGFQKENTAAHNVMNNKVASLEKWRWMLVGGGTVLGAVLSTLARIVI